MDAIIPLIYVHLIAKNGLVMKLPAAKGRLADGVWWWSLQDLWVGGERELHARWKGKNGPPSAEVECISWTRKAAACGKALTETQSRWSRWCGTKDGNHGSNTIGKKQTMPHRVCACMKKRRSASTNWFGSFINDSLSAPPLFQHLATAPRASAYFHIHRFYQLVPPLTSANNSRAKKNARSVRKKRQKALTLAVLRQQICIRKVCTLSSTCFSRPLAGQNAPEMHILTGVRLRAVCARGSETTKLELPELQWSATCNAGWNFDADTRSLALGWK